MSDGGPYLQDILRNRRRSGFVGRQGQVAQYRANPKLPVTDEQHRFLFNVHGIAGVGKTYPDPAAAGDGGKLRRDHRVLR